MAQGKKKKADYGVLISVRVAKEVKEALVGLAKKDRRPLGQYVTILLENHIATPRPLQIQPLPSITGDSEPPRRIAQQAAARGKAPQASPPAVQEIIESDEGWEPGADRNLLAGTKVKP